MKLIGLRGFVSLSKMLTRGGDASFLHRPWPARVTAVTPGLITAEMSSLGSDAAVQSLFPG